MKRKHGLQPNTVVWAVFFEFFSSVVPGEPFLNCKPVLVRRWWSYFCPVSTDSRIANQLKTGAELWLQMAQIPDVKVVVRAFTWEELQPQLNISKLWKRYGLHAGDARGLLPISGIILSTGLESVDSFYGLDVEGLSYKW